MTRDPDSRQAMRDGSRLRDITSRRGARGKPSPENTEPAPGSVYEAVTRQMVHSLRGEVRDVKSRINQLITIVIGAIMLEVLMRLIGVSG